MSLGRLAAAAVYLSAAVAWAFGMWLGSGLGCEYGCSGLERHQLDLTFVFSLIGVGLSVAAVLGSLVNRRLALLLLATHASVFLANLIVLSELPDDIVGSPWVQLGPGLIAAVAGYVAVGGPSSLPVGERRSSGVKEAGD